MNGIDRTIMTLDKHVWKTNFRGPKISEWFKNFENNEETLTCVNQLLCNFVYFNNEMVREMLKALYRDIFMYPIKQKIILLQGYDETDVESAFKKELSETRFLGVGNPSESGPYLLYLFRQVNHLPKELFIESGEAISQKNKLMVNIKRYVYIDDVSISGSQLTDYAKNKRYSVTAKRIKELDSSAEVHCYLLFAKEDAIKKIDGLNIFDSVKSVFEIDDSFECFSNKSRYFDNTQNEGRELKEQCSSIVKTYGKQFGYSADHAAGFKNSQILLGFEHNTPDNTPPIFWHESPTWAPLFKRYDKNYG